AGSSPGPTTSFLVTWFRWLRRGPPELKLPLLGVHPCSRRAAWCQESVPRLCPSPSLTKPLIPPLGCGRPSPISASIETDTFDNERPQGGFFDRVTLVEVDGTNRLAVQTRVEEALRILQLGTRWKGQPRGVPECCAAPRDAAA